MEKKEYKVMYQVEANHFWFVGMWQISKLLLKKYINKDKKLRILDAGCGTGMSMELLKQYGVVHGIDISDYAIHFCKKRQLKNLKVGSIDKLPYRSNYFDLVTCFDVLGQKEVEYKKALKEIKRVLKPGGLFLARIAAMDWLYSQHDVMVHAKHRFSLAELKNDLVTVGFLPMRLTYANTLLFPFVLVRRLLAKTLKIYASGSDVKTVSKWENSIGTLAFRIEKELLKYANLPYGLSVIALAKKKAKPKPRS